MEIILGAQAEFTKIICRQDVEVFAELSGDNNPIHLDEDYASKSIFKKPIVHGILTAGLISSVIANRLPGEGSIYLGQDLKFTAPVYHGDILTAKVEVIEIIKEKRQAILRTEVINQNGEVVLTGQARVKHINI